MTFCFIGYLADSVVYRIKYLLGITYQQKLWKQLSKTQFAIRDDNGAWRGNSETPDVILPGFVKN